MSVQFTIRGKDILQLKAELLRLGHPERDKCWIIFLEVTPVMASFRFGETTVQYPVDGKRQALQDSLRSYSATQPGGSQRRNPPREVPFGTRQGRIWCGEGHDSGGIEVGYFRDPNTGGRFISAMPN